MKVSVLICTYNRDYLLKECLRGLVEDTLEKPDEIVIVNGGDASADKVVNNFLGRHGIKILLVKTVNKNLAASRNVGLPYCSGDIVAMTDDDAVVAPDWITRMKQDHQDHPEAGAVGGTVAALDTSFLAQKISDIIIFAYYSQPTYVRFVAGVNASYKRKVIESVGLQDELLFRGEDVDYNWRVLKLGYKIYYDPAIKVYHTHPATLKNLFYHQYMYGRAYYLVRKKWPEMYSVYPHGLKRGKDILKLAYFFLGVVVEPIFYSKRSRGVFNNLLVFPVLIVCQILWKSGMILEKYFHGKSSNSKKTDSL